MKKFNELLLEEIKLGNTEFKIGEYYFSLSNYYKYRDPYHQKGCLIFITEQRINDIFDNVNHIPFYWFNLELQKFTPFYQARRNNYGGLQDSLSLKKFNLTFKEFKKLQKKHLEQVNYLMKKLCYPLVFELEENLTIKEEKRKVNKI